MKKSVRPLGLALILSLTLVWTGARGEVEVLEETNGSITLRATFDGAEGTVLALPGLPPLRYHRVFVAVPDGADVRVDVLGGSFFDDTDKPPPITPNPDGIEPTLGDGLDGGFFPAQPFVVNGPFGFRKRRVFAVDLHAYQVDDNRNVARRWTRYSVRISYPPARRIDGAIDVDPLVAELVINRGVIPSIAASKVGRSVAADPHFSLSPNWVKIRVTAAGVYSVDGRELAGVGVNLESIMDPASFRLFTLGGWEQPDDVTDPAGTWQIGAWMRECDIEVDYGSDGSFDLGDQVIFYAHGVEGFEDLFDPQASPDRYVRHSRALENVYFLTWDSAFPGAPARMDSIVAAPGGGPDVTRFEERLHLETDRVQNFDFGGDGWLWLDVAPGSGPETRFLTSFDVPDPDLSRPQTFKTAALANYRVFEQNTGHHAVYLMNGVAFADTVWDTKSGHDFDNGPRVTRVGSFVRDGANQFSLHLPRDQNAEDFMFFSHFEVDYWRWLRALGDALLFVSPDTTGTVDFGVTGFSTTGDIDLFDVSDPFRPVRLQGMEVTTSGSLRDMRFSSVVSGRQRYWAGATGGLRNPVGMSLYTPRDLRDVATPPNMVIITDPAFLNDAQRLGQHRRTRLPYFQSPVVEVVTAQQVYDNFSGGLPDPMAIRNYCKFLYDHFPDGNGSPSLTYLLLLGDANADFRRIRSSQPDFVTTNLNLRPFFLEAYTTDELFTTLDADDTPGSRFGDIAVGRLPAGSTSEARFLVDRVIEYELQRDFGSWRARVILVADDEKSPFGGDEQDDFINLTEDIAHNIMAPYLDGKKIYLTEFPSIQGIKPASRLEFINSWNDGAVLINYVGHGSEAQMADEQVFLQSDVGNLRNGLRLPLFCGLSCTIGNFTNAQTKSLSERLLLRDDGGVIGTVTATQLSLIGANDALDTALFEELFSNEPGLSAPLGVGLMRAKFNTLAPTAPNRLMEENNHKYNLLGDPALQLLAPLRSVEIDSTDIDTLTTGKRHRIRGSVLLEGQLDPTFNGNVELTIREPDDPSGYTTTLCNLRFGSEICNIVRQDTFYLDTLHIDYRYPRGTIYRGTASVVAGRFEFSIKVPRFAERGPAAFALAYSENGQVDAVDKNEDVVFSAPSLGDSTALEPADGPPRVNLGFKGDLVTVKPGAVLQARVSDADGINILSTTPEGRLALVFDQTNLPVDVTEFFEFDHGGVDTSGTMEFPLPQLALGEHRVVFKVSDTFGQTRLDTLDFLVTDPLDYSARVVLNYPNPFESSTYFLLTLTEPARVRLEIFTVSGKRIRTLEENAAAGEAWILWDGRDMRGDVIANGTYLYVAEVSFVGVDRPASVLRGKVVKIE